jgi:malate/lactate dehydrogenase
LPTVIGRHGVLRTLPPKMSQEERDGLERSALVLREALEGARRRDG